MKSKRYKRDRLDRLRTKEMAVLTQKAECPFWVTLTPWERTKMPHLEAWFHRMGDKRREFRYFVRGMADKVYTPSARANEIAERYARIGARRGWKADEVRTLICRRLWVLRHGHSHGVVCV